MRYALILVGCVATALAIAGAILPGLPTTPFLLVALWAFARSSERLHAWLMRVPILQSAMAEVTRFEEKKAIRPTIKAFAFCMAWGSVAFTWFTAGTTRPILFWSVFCAAVLATLFLALIGTDRD